MIHFFRLQPFIVTLAGMFFARGLCFLITTQSITITDPTFKAISAYRLPIGTGSVSANVLIALVTLVAAIFVAHFTRFGRNVYAVGGNPRSALLMGLPVAQTRIGVYALSGFCSALGGAVFTFYVLSGYGLQGQGMELDAIAATVIGGTLLTGGVGYVIGSLFGVGILGTIQTLITFDGTLSSWWTRIVIGALLCAFCLLQRLIERHARSVRRPGGPAGAVVQRHRASAHVTTRPLRIRMRPAACRKRVCPRRWTVDEAGAACAAPHDGKGQDATGYCRARESSTQEGAAFGFRQGECGEDHHAIGRGRKYADRMSERHGLRDVADQERKRRADRPSEVVAEALAGAANPGRKQLGEERAHPRENTGREEAERKAEHEHGRGCRAAGACTSGRSPPRPARTAMKARLRPIASLTYAPAR